MDLKKRSRLFINLKKRRCGRSMALYIFKRQRSAMFHADHPTDIQSHAKVLRIFLHFPEGLRPVLHESGGIAGAVIPDR